MRKVKRLLNNKKFLLRLGSIALLFVFAYLINLFVFASNVKVYFLKDEKLKSVKRKLNDNSPLLTIANSITTGPNRDEQVKGFYSEIPADTAILSVTRIKNIALVDFNQKLEGYGGGASRIQALIGQIVYSFTELPGIDKVKITVNGEEEVVLGGEGFVIDKPLSRKDLSLN
ncbi:GerMN domain-containing protein [Candidatus Margulisiibacteriota bacterium]